MTKTKRGFDLVLSFVGLVLTSPAFVVIAALVKAEDGGPIFFQHARVGKRGRPFRMWKFRTMTPTFDKPGPQLTVRGDPRITRVGAWLRSKKLDELPQLFNVLLGEMTVVGPRPEVPRYVHMYTDDQRKVLDLAPGITDVASIAFANESDLLAGTSDPEHFYVERIIPEKIRLNLEYARRATVWSDLGVVLQTVCAVVPRNPSRRVSVTALGSDLHAN